MFDNLTGVAYGLVTFAVLTGVGLIVLQNFGVSVSNCITGYNYTTSNGLCSNNTAANQTMNPSASTAATYTLSGYLGTSSGGLVTWVLAIIALIIGVLFIAMLMGRQQKKY